MIKSTNCWLLASLLTVMLTPAAAVAQDSYTVTSLGDGGAWDDPGTDPTDESMDGVCNDGTGECTLRAALEEAANRGNSVTITFAVTGTIATSGSLSIPDNSEILGTNRTITLQSTGSGFSGENKITIKDLIIRVHPQAAACYVGSNSTVTGVHVLSGGVGIAVVDNCTIGGGSVQDRNVVGGCTSVGIDLGGNGNTVKGNYVGVDPSGNTALANGLGIAMSGGSGNIIGGVSSGERNIISGNAIAGIMAAGTNTIVQGNYIGIGANGVSSIPNGTGIQMQGTGTLGGDLSGERNVISNNQTGVSLGEDGDGNSGVVVKGNYIGTDITGMMARGNTTAGITVGSGGHRIEHNIISANGTTGIGLISIQGVQNAINNIIAGNRIGTDASGLTPLPNAAGILLQGPSNDNIVGEGLLAAYEGNTIAFNSGPGIFVDAQQAFGGIPQGNTFRKNSIFNNSDLGIRIQSPAQGDIAAPIIDSMKSGILYGHGAVPDARIDVYAAAPDPSGEGEGKTWLANGIALSDGSFEIPVVNTNCNPPTATQTDLNRNTSQFSKNLGIDPAVVRLVPECDQTFLVGVSIVNPFTATIDWRGVPDAGRSVTFDLNGDVHQGSLAGDIATTTYNMGGISAGTNTMRVKATSCGGTSQEFSYEFCGTTVPPWAAPAGSIIGSGASCAVMYSKVFLFPDPAIVPNLPFINNIPFVGGALGFLSTQAHISMSASSGGGAITNEDVGLNSTFSLAGESFSLTTSGSTNTTLACGSLNLDGTLTATVAVSHTYSWGTDLSALLPATCPSVPILDELCQSARAIAQLASLGAEVGGSIGITADYQAGSSIQFTGGSGQGSIFIRPFINVFPFHAEGRGTLALQVDIPSFDTHGQLSLEFTVSAGPFGSHSYGPYTWSGMPSLPVPAERDKDDSRSSVSQAIARAPAEAADQDTLVVSGIPADAAPVVALGPTGERVVVWSDFNTSAARPSGDIGLKIFDGTAWGPTIFLNADIQVDQNPTAAFDNAGHVLICWERNLTTSIPRDTAIYVPGYLQGFDVQYAILSANTGGVQGTGSFGGGLVYDFAPRLSGGVDGSVLLVWESTSGNTIFGNLADPAALISVRWNGSAWGTPSVVSSSLTGIHSWEVANRSKDTSLVALVLDTDGDLSTPEDWELHTISWNGTEWSSLTRLTNDSRVDWGVHAAYAGDGRPVLGWLRDSLVVGVIGDLMQQPGVWLGDSANVGLEFINGKLATGAGKMLLAWPEVGNISFSGANVVLPDWSQPSTRSTEADERSLSLAVDETGQAVFGFLRVPFRGNGSTLSDTADIYLSTIDLGPIITEVKKDPVVTPGRFILMDAFPNPFNPETEIGYLVPGVAMVTLRVYDLLGREVTTLVNEVKAPGRYSARWDASGCASGIYLYRMMAGDFVVTKKLVLVK